MEQALPVPEAVWVATALLHREHPDRGGFQVEEIQTRLRGMGYPERAEPRVEVHATLQLVANMRPNPATYRYLYATPDGGRRLYRPGDDHHTDREEGATHPREEALPDAYQGLLAWYRNEYVDTDAAAEPSPVPDATPAPDAPASGQRITYKVLRVEDPAEAETLLKRFAEDGWRLRNTVAANDPELGTTVWLFLERSR